MNSSNNEKLERAGRPHSKDQRHESDWPGSVESRIGLYWLSRLGIGFLVVGVALLISYSFQYFGPAAKLATGFLSSFALLFFAEFLERKKSIFGFSRILAGGGWSLAFFTTFAMHHIQSVRVVDNPYVAFAFMAMTVIAAVSHAVAKRSELMAVIAVLLGFITVFLGPTGLFSAAACTLLAGATAFLTVKMRWFGLNIAALAGAYVCYSGVHDNLSTIAPDVTQQFWLTSAYLLPTWLCNMWATLNLSEDKKSERAAGLTTAIINSSAFLALWLPALNHAFGSNGACAYPAIGAFNLACARLAESRSQKALSILYTMVGLTLLTMYIPTLLNQNWSTFAMAVEGIALTGLGLRYNIRSFRWFAILLSLRSLVVTGTDMVVHSSAATEFPVFCQWSLVGTWIASAYLYTCKQFAEKVSGAERELAFHVYTTFAAGLALFIPITWLSIKLPTDSQPAAFGISWSLEALLWAAFATTTRRIYPAVLSGFAMLCAAFSTWIPGHPPMPMLVNAAAMYLPVLYARSQTNKDVVWVKGLSYSLLMMASLGTAAFIQAYANHGFAALLTTFQAFVIFLFGLAKKDRGVRMCAMPFFLVGCLLQGLTQGITQCTVSVASLLYTVGLLYDQNRDLGTERELRHVFYIAATFILALFSAQTFENGWISCAWAVQGAVLLACGFRLKDTWLRVLGLGLFGLLAGKLLFVDFAGAEAIHRILAFIVGGLALLGSSLAYTRVARKVEKEDSLV